MYCHNCGNKIDNAGNFCEKCGVKLQDNNSVYFYNDSNRINYNQPVQSSEGKVAGILCGIFVPFIIAIFIGLVFSNPTSRSNYYKYYFIVIGIKILFVFFIVLLALAMAATNPY